VTAVGWAIAVFGVFAAFAIGSFTNVVIARLPLRLEAPNEFGEEWDTRPWPEVVGGTSHCSTCGARIRPRDEIPVVSWLLLRGRCRDCGARIPAYHPVVELAVPVVSVLMVLAIGWTWVLLPVLFLVPVGIAVTAVDIRTLMVPTRLVWPAFVITVVLSMIAALAEQQVDWLYGGLVGMVVLAGPLFLVWFVHPRGMGFGDVRLTVVLGWAVGFVAVASGASIVVSIMVVIICLALASIIGIVIGLALLGRRRQIPFGPALVIASFVCMAFSEQIVRPFLR